jgi:hypothetical protein
MLPAALLSGLALAAPAPVLDMATVALHDRPEDCWAVVDGQVHDLTAFLEGHPGGAAITRACGKDASRLFREDRGDGGGHSAAAEQVLASLRIGALGDPLPAGPAPTPPHPHALRAGGMRAGMLPDLAVPGHLRPTLSVVHHVPTAEADPLRVGLYLGLGLGKRVHVELGETTGDGVSGLSAKVLALDQHADAWAPLGLALIGGAGMAHGIGSPAAWTQAVFARDLWERRIRLRAVGTGAWTTDQPGVAVGGGVELRPIPVHGIFAELSQPLGVDGPLQWSAGARLYTRAHHFSLSATQPGVIAPALQTRATEGGVQIGFVIERVFGRDGS